MTDIENEYLDNMDSQMRAKAAASIVNDCLKVLLSNLKPGATALQLSQLGDQLINDACSKTFKKASSKGIAFPTCVNVNGIVCHYSPLENDDPILLREKDVVRVDMGVHIDGYIAVAAQTVFLTNETITGKAADLLAAAHDALNASLRLMKPGHKNTELAPVVNKIAEEYGVNVCEGVLGHEMKRYVVDGANCILLKPSAEYTVPEFEFETYHTYALDIVLTTGDGKLFEHPAKATVYKYMPENNYVLKSKTARETLQIIKDRELPFSVRSLPNQTRSRLGLIELYNTSIVDRYPVIACKDDELVVQIKTTVHVLPSGVQSVTGIPNVQAFQSQHRVQDPNVLRIMSSSLKPNKKSKKKNKKSRGAAAGDSMDMSED